MRKPLKIREGTERSDQLVTIDNSERTGTTNATMVSIDGVTFLNKPLKINNRTPPERINSGIKELMPFVISSNDTDKSVTIVTDLRLSSFLRSAQIQRSVSRKDQLFQ